MLAQVLTEAKYKGNAADVWSLGVMLYVMIEGAPCARFCSWPLLPTRSQQHIVQFPAGNVECPVITHVQQFLNQDAPQLHPRGLAGSDYCFRDLVSGDAKEALGWKIFVLRADR